MVGHAERIDARRSCGDGLEISAHRQHRQDGDEGPSLQLVDVDPSVELVLDRLPFDDCADGVERLHAETVEQRPHCGPGVVLCPVVFELPPCQGEVDDRLGVVDVGIAEAVPIVPFLDRVELVETFPILQYRLDLRLGEPVPFIGDRREDVVHFDVVHLREHALFRDLQDSRHETHLQALVILQGCREESGQESEHPPPSVRVSLVRHRGIVLVHEYDGPESIGLEQHPAEEKEG